MEYLFFDIECANCFDGKGKICSLGYVLTDEKFNVIKKDEIFVNPRAAFDYYVVKKVLLCDPKSYLAYKDFGEQYEEIRNLLTQKGRRVFGYGVLTDMEFIMCDCIRYGKEFFGYSAIDVQKMYRNFSGAETGLRLSDVAAAININEEFTAHRSLDDAYMTMLVLKNISKATGKSVEQLVCEWQNSVIKNDGKVLTNKQWKEILSAYRYDLGPGNEGAETVCVDEAFEAKKPREACILYKALSDRGVGVDFSGSNCTLFLEYKKGLEKRPQEKRRRASKTAPGTVVKEVTAFAEEEKINLEECSLPLLGELRKYLKK